MEAKGKLNAAYVEIELICVTCLDEEGLKNSDDKVCFYMGLPSRVLSKLLVYLELLQENC